ncbi:MAG: sulfite exporter TauE/SafE family protein [Desulfosarcinaceae bacterium]|nr:sulfite exporter TauE/SafE family protein [Desulfosarcinaceae bacterium]
MTNDMGLLGLVGTALLLLCGGLLHGILGMGFPLVTTPLLSLFIDVRRVMLLLLLPTVSINLVSVIRGSDWQRQIRRYYPLAIWGVVGSAAGSSLLAIVDPEPFKLLLAAAILVYLQAARFGSRLAWVRRRTGLAMLVFGLIGGFLAGTVNVMVPALIVFALESGLPMRSVVQVFNFCFLLGKLTQALTFAQLDVLNLSHLIPAVPLAGVTLAGLAIGFRLQRRVTPASYRRALTLLLYVMSAMLLIQGGARLVAWLSIFP